MMALSVHEVHDLSKRCQFSMAYGYEIAQAEHYATELGYAGGDPPPGVAKFSPAHLLHLIDKGAPSAKTQASAKFVKAGKAAKKAPEPVKVEEPVNVEEILSVHEAVAALESSEEILSVHEAVAALESSES